MTPIHLKPTQFAWFLLSFPKKKKSTDSHKRAIHHAGSVPEPVLPRHKGRCPGHGALNAAAAHRPRLTLRCQNDNFVTHGMSQSAFLSCKVCSAAPLA